MAVCLFVPDGKRATPPIKPALSVDGRAFQPVWGGATPLQGLFNSNQRMNPDECCTATADAQVIQDDWWC
jgi:hypothetical protein